MICRLQSLFPLQRLLGKLNKPQKLVGVLGLGWSVSLLKAGLRLWQYRLGGQIWQQLSSRFCCI